MGNATEHAHLNDQVIHDRTWDDLEDLRLASAASKRSAELEILVEAHEAWTWNIRAQMFM